MCTGYVQLNTNCLCIPLICAVETPPPPAPRPPPVQATCPAFFSPVFPLNRFMSAASQEKSEWKQAVTKKEAELDLVRGKLGTSQVWGSGRDALEEGGAPPPPPLQAAQPMPSHCPPDAKCPLQWHW